MYQSIFYILVGLFITIANGISQGCNNQQDDVIERAQKLAVEGYMMESLHYLVFNEHATPRYTTWFGNFTEGRYINLYNRYHDIFDQIKNVTFICSDCTSSNNKVGYVTPSDFGPMYLCDLFWNLPTNGTDSQPMTMIELTSQFDILGSAKTYATGQENCKQLAKSNPDQAIDNAANLAYFVVNDPPLE